MRDLVEPLLSSYTGEHRTEKQLGLINELISFLREHVEDSPVLADDALAAPARQLLPSSTRSARRRRGPGAGPPGDPSKRSAIC